MKQYDIEIEEILSRVVRIEANNISEAIEKAEEKIDNQEIVLTADDYSGERNFRNFNSKKLDKKLNFFLNFNSKDGILTIFHDNNREAKYVCDTIQDLKNCIKIYIDNYMEESEIEATKNNDDIELER